MFKKGNKGKKLQQGKKFYINRGKRVNSFNRFNFCNFCIATFVTLVTIYTFATSVVFAGIATTKHNLSAGGPHVAGQTIYAAAGGTTEICVFCHTPHSASKEASIPDSPLWNHSISSANYSVKGPPQPLVDPWRVTTPGQPDRSSKLCLGCHDGTVAIGLLLNTPGSGSTYPIPLSMVGTSGGFMPTTATGYIGTDLTGANHINHMVSIEYNMALVNQLTNVKCLSGDSTQTLVDVPLPSTNPVKTYKTNHTNSLPPLGSANSGYGIQCRTCHDPHDDTSPHKCFLVNPPVPSHAPIGTTPVNCTGGPTGCCSNLGNNYDALCYTCHKACP